MFLILLVKLSQVSGRAAFGTETRGEKTHSGFDPNPRSPPSNLAVPTAFYFVSKLRAQTSSFGKGWDFQSPVRHPAHVGCLDRRVLGQTELLRCKEVAITAFNAVETPK